MPVNIKGSEYMTVAERLHMLYQDHPQATVKTKVLRMTDTEVVMTAKITVEGRSATGTAHEVQGEGMINSTSHIENCETSAVGRALALFGYAGSEVRSADEMSAAVMQQTINAMAKRMAACSEAVRRNWDAIQLIRDIVGDPNTTGLDVAAEAWYELPPEDKEALWLAPSKGGIFTTKDREVLKSSEFRAAYYGEE